MTTFIKQTSIRIFKIFHTVLSKILVEQREYKYDKTLYEIDS